MKKSLLLSILYLITFASTLLADDGVLGFWKNIDENSGKAQILVAVYEHNNKVYGRILALYDLNGNIKESIEAPKSRAPGVVGNPFYCGLDLIWDLKKSGDRYKHGSIIDPKKGKTYGVEMWPKDGNLIVRGKLLFFGRNQTWLRADGNDFPPNFKKPDLKTLIPVIPQPDSG